jgi:pimeloyl-ACP methyl ester carboxylesterase
MPFFEGGAATIYYEQTGKADGKQLVWVGGGGTIGRDWHRFQTPYFADEFRSLVYDNRGIGWTICRTPQPWTIDRFSDDLAELVAGTCSGPAIFVGTSLGSAIIQQLAIDHPELVRAAILMGTGAWSTGWGWDYQDAEIEFRRRGGRLDGMMGVTHYAAMLYPARALGNRELWPKLRALLLEWMDSGENEESLAPQWEASLRFDQREALRSVRTPVHVISFSEDVQAPPQDGKEVAELIPSATYHLLEGMGHGSWYGHAHDEINELIRMLAMSAE